MSALYKMLYTGIESGGAGVVYIGNGNVLGIDTGDFRYHGTYTENAGRIRGTVTMTATTDGSRLVTGDTLNAGQTLPFNIDWPEAFSDGTQQPIFIGGRRINVTIEKLGDIPLA